MLYTQRFITELHSEGQMATDETVQIRFQSQIWPGLRTQVLTISIFYKFTGYRHHSSLKRIVCDQSKEF